MQGMVYVDGSGLSDTTVLRRAWVQRGTDYVATHPAKTKQRKRSWRAGTHGARYAATGSRSRAAATGVMTGCQWARTP